MNQVKQVVGPDNEGADGAKPVAAAKKTRKRSSSAAKATNAADSAGDAEMKMTPEEAGSEVAEVKGTHEADGVEAAEVKGTHEAGQDSKEAAEVKEKSEADGVEAAEVKGGTQDVKVDEEGRKSQPPMVEAGIAESTREGRDEKEVGDEL